MSEVAKGKLSELQPARDENQYRRLFESDVFAFSGTEELQGSSEFRDSQRASFLSGKIDNPSFDYPRLTEHRLDEVDASLKTLKQDIKQDISSKPELTGLRLEDISYEPLLTSEVSENEALAWLYRWRINTDRARVMAFRQTLRAGQLLDQGVSADDDTPEGRSLARTYKNFQRLTEFIYGKPKPEVFDYTLAKVHERIGRALRSDNESLQVAAQNLQAKLPTSQGETAVGLPAEAEFDVVKDEVNQLTRGGELIQLPEKEGRFNAEEMVDIFNDVIAKMGASEVGWVAQLRDPEDTKTAMTVSQRMKKLLVPRERTHTPRQLKDKIVHEVRTHLSRSFRALEGGVLLMQEGLDRTKRVEEGIATLRETGLKSYGKVTEFGGLDSSLGLGLALGLDGRPRNFRQTYDVLEAYFAFLDAEKGKSNPKTPQQRAYDRATRTFLGSPNPAEPGLCIRDDLAYREGEVALWAAIADDPKVVELFDLGKFDPINERHVWALRILHVIEEDPEELVGREE